MRPAARRLGIASAASAAVLVGALAARFGWDNFFRADGISFLMVARHITGDTLGAGDNAYRYGRVFYPFAGLVVAGGHEVWLRWSLPLVNCLAFGASVAFAGELAASSQRAVRHGLIVLAIPALWFCLGVAWSESLLVALLLGFAVCHIQGREVPAAGCLALAVLTKETAALALVPLCLDALRRRDWRALAVRTTAGLVPVMWWTWTRVRLGEWPFLASTPSRTEAVTFPLGGLVDLVRIDGVTTASSIEIALVIGVAVAGVVLWARRPCSVLAGSAALMGVFALFLGVHVLIFFGDTLRVLSPALAMVYAAAVTQSRPATSEVTIQTGRRWS